MWSLQQGLETTHMEVGYVQCRDHLKLMPSVSVVMSYTFKHRAWNHICWNFESTTGINKMYLNGELQGSFEISSDFTRRGVLGSDEVFESAFIIGQEPDPPSPRGGFEAEQVFVGHITELNMWNYTLSEIKIKLKGTCKNFDKGNIIGWDLDNFIVNDVKVGEVKLEEFCNSGDRLLVFPKKRSWSAAWTLCSAHGGMVHTPNDDIENNELINIMKPYNAECADPMSGNLVWLGIKSKNYIWYKINYDKSLAVQKFLNWKVTAPYFKNYECGFATVNKTWDSDTNCHKKVKMCTVCKLSGK